MNKRSRERNKERNKYAKLKNLVLKSANAVDPINVPNCNGSCIEAFDDYYWQTNDQAKQVEKLAKYKNQRIERGFDDTELWNLDKTIAKYILPRLVEFRKVVNGYPPEFDKFEDWLDIIDQMIYAFDYIVNYDKYDDELDESLGIDWVGYYKERKRPDGNYDIVHGKNYDQELLDKRREILEHENVKVQNGLDLFAKYFLQLWW